MHGLDQVQQSLLGLDARHADQPKGLPGRRLRAVHDGESLAVDPVGLDQDACRIGGWCDLDQLTSDALGSGDHDAAQLQVQRHHLELVVLEQVVGVAADPSRKVQHVGGDQRHQGTIVEEVGVEVVRPIGLCHPGEREALQEVVVGDHRLGREA
jgi:hypothetical protein